jgi:hypothetical protein
MKIGVNQAYENTRYRRRNRLRANLLHVDKRDEPILCQHPSFARPGQLKSQRGSAPVRDFGRTGLLSERAGLGHLCFVTATQ